METPNPGWRPPVSEGQLRILSLKQRPNVNLPISCLVSGPRLTSKTFGIEHLACKHMWETPGAQVAVVAKTTKTATDGGIWEDMLTYVVPKWIEGGIGFEYTSKDRHGVRGPKIDSTTKTHYFKIRNMMGGDSSLRLNSVDNIKEVEAIFKSRRFSMVWISELSLYPDQSIFTQSWAALRMPHLKDHEHIWIADTNPAEDGTESWIYKKWYVERVDKNHPEPETRDSLHLIELFQKDNPYLGKSKFVMLAGEYSGDPDGYARNIDGKWKGGTKRTTKHFSDVFSRQKHVVGESDEESMEVSLSTTDLFGSWDLGNSMNSSFHILEKRVIGGRSYWYVHDEVVSLDDQISTEAFTLQALARMAALEQVEGRTFNYRHWSDSSSLDTYRAAIDGYDYQIVMAASNGKIVLNGAVKPPGSVHDRVKQLRLLLREGRIFVASRCHHTIAMLENCGKSKTKFVADDQHKHSFDSLTYAIYMEMIDDFLLADTTPVVRKSNLVSVS